MLMRKSIFYTLILIIGLLIGVIAYRWPARDFPGFTGCKSEPIDLTSLDQVTCRASITELDRYTLNVRYSLKSPDLQESRRVRNIINHKGVVKVQTVVQSIERQNTRELMKQVTYPKENSHAFDALYAEIVRIELKPGLYEFKVNNLSEISAMKDVTTHIVLRKAYEGK